MKLFLSSENLGNYPKVFLKMIGGRKLAVIENAKDDWPESERKNKIEKHLSELSEHGFDAEEIDLRQYFDKKRNLLERLNNFGGIFVFGGNTFILRRALQASGADNHIINLVKNNRMVYGGSSAGSCVAAPSLRGLETDGADDPTSVPEGYSGTVIWEGLNLVPYYIVPHFGSDWFGKEAAALENYYQENRLPHKILRDGQVIVIKGGKEELLT